MVWQQSEKGYRSPLMATAVAVVAGLVVATTMATGNVVVAEMVVGGGSGGGGSSGRDVGGGGGGGGGGGSGDAGGRKHERKLKIRAAWAGSSRADTAFPLSHLHFCLGCPDPGAEGSLVLALAPHHGLRDFMVAGDVVYAVPNNCKGELLNGEDMPGRVVLVERGEVPIVEKVLKAQAAGATGVVVADNGGCSDGFADCGRLGGVRDAGFARRDGAHAWAGVKIPAILVSQVDGGRLRGMMRLQRVVVEGQGEQLVER